MSQDLKPGDLCVVHLVPVPGYYYSPEDTLLEGRVVVLLRIADYPAHGSDDLKPYWACSNTAPSKTIGISHVCLRKIEPPFLEEDESEEEELLV